VDAHGGTPARVILDLPDGHGIRLGRVVGDHTRAGGS
jgi:hypothetical protein